MAENGPGGSLPTRPREPVTAKSEVLVEGYRFADAPASCTVCGRAEENLSVPYGRCLPCIKAASETWEAQRTRGSEVAEAEDVPEFYRRFFPPRSTLEHRQYTPRGNVHGRLRGLLTTVNRAVEGQRNTVLHWATCRVAEMVAAGELSDPHGAVDALRQVALGTGLEPREVEGTIRSGLSTSGVYL